MVSFLGRFQKDIVANVLDSLFSVRGEGLSNYRKSGQIFLMLEAQKCGKTEALLMSVIKCKD